MGALQADPRASVGALGWYALVARDQGWSDPWHPKVQYGAAAEIRSKLGESSKFATKTNEQEGIIMKTNLARRLGAPAVVLASLTAGSVALASPSYTADPYGQGEEEVYCYGSGFSPGYRVWIGTWANGGWIAGEYITADSSGDIIYGGNCAYPQAQCPGYYESYAWDEHTTTYANGDVGQQVYVSCLE